MLPTVTRCAIQWGNVAEWVAGVGTVGALLLALWLLAQDRRNAQRAQVDLVGAWGKPIYEHKSPWDVPRVEKAQTVIYVRNGSQLPVEVKKLAYSIHTMWMKPVLGSKQESQPVPGKEAIRRFVEDLRIPPAHLEQQGISL